jgi:hypothetical protein
VIFGAHLVMFSADAEADRSFLGDVLGLEAVDAGQGWLIFALPPAEAAVHPADTPGGSLYHPGRTLGTSLYLMCDDVEAEVRSLSQRGVTCSDIEDAGWGLVTNIRLPSGGELGLYQPRHPTAITNSI